MNRYALTAVAALSLCLSACGPSVEGTWTGTIEESDQALSLSLAENSGAVSGVGTISLTYISLTLTVAGAYSAPDLTATLTPSSREPTTLTAKVDGDTLTGTLTGSGFRDTPVTLTRAQ